MLIVFTIELNLFLPCFGLSALYCAYTAIGDLARWPVMYGRGQLGSIRLKTSRLLPFPFLLYLFYDVQLSMYQLTLIYMAAGLHDTHSFEWPFFFKFLCTKIVKQFLFLSQSIVFIHMFLNLWNSFCKYLFEVEKFPEICIACSQDSFDK